MVVVMLWVRERVWRGDVEDVGADIQLEGGARVDGLEVRCWGGEIAGLDTRTASRGERGLLLLWLVACGRGGGGNGLGAFALFLVLAAASEGAVAEEAAAFLLDGLGRASGLGGGVIVVAACVEGFNGGDGRLDAGHGSWVRVVALRVAAAGADGAGSGREVGLAVCAAEHGHAVGWIFIVRDRSQIYSRSVLEGSLHFGGLAAEVGLGGRRRCLTVALEGLVIAFGCCLVIVTAHVPCQVRVGIMVRLKG